MRQLFLIRHSNAINNPTEPDIERPLSDVGKNNGFRMARRISAKNISPNLIITSPARRAYETAVIFAEEMYYPIDKIAVNNIIYEGGNIESFLNILSEVDDSVKTLFLFGHNPSISELSGLFDSKFGNLLHPASVAGFEFDFENWNEIGINSGRSILSETP